MATHRLLAITLLALAPSTLAAPPPEDKRFGWAVLGGIYILIGVILIQFLYPHWLLK